MRLIVMSFAATLVAASTALAAPLSYTGGAYSQNFDGLPVSNGFADPFVVIPGHGPHDIAGQLSSSGVAGWTMSNYAGSSADTEYRAQDGALAGSNGRGVVSFGTNDSTERALGELPTSNQISRFGVAFTNDTGSTLTQFALNFTAEQWRRGDVGSPASGQNALKYDYAITSAPLDDINTDAIFSNLGSVSSPVTTGTNVALNGNLPANQVPVALAVNNINWAPGATLFVRWSGFDASGQDDGLAIDDLQFSAAVPEPASAMIAFIAAMCVGRSRSRRS